MASLTAWDIASSLGNEMSILLRLWLSVMNINKLQKACIFISADPRPTHSVQGLSGSMVVVLSS